MRPWGQMLLRSPLLNGRPRVINRGRERTDFPEGWSRSQHKGILEQVAGTSERSNKVKKSVLLFVFTLDLSGVLSLGTENRKQNSPNSPMYVLLFLKSY